MYYELEVAGVRARASDGGILSYWSVHDNDFYAVPSKGKFWQGGDVTHVALGLVAAAECLVRLAAERAQKAAKALAT